MRLFQNGIFSVPVCVTGKCPSDFRQGYDLSEVYLHFWDAEEYGLYIGPRSCSKILQQYAQWYTKFMAKLAYPLTTKAPQVFLCIKISELFVFWRVQNSLRATRSFVRTNMTHSQPCLLNAKWYSILQCLSPPSLLLNSLVSLSHLIMEIFCSCTQSAVWQTNHPLLILPDVCETESCPPPNRLAVLWQWRLLVAKL